MVVFDLGTNLLGIDEDSTKKIMYNIKQITKCDNKSLYICKCDDSTYFPSITLTLDG